jgi:hypothetical protein
MILPKRSQGEAESLHNAPQTVSIVTKCEAKTERIQKAHSS